MQEVSRGSSDPLLKRPFAPYFVDKNTGDYGILYAIVGKGTRLLAAAKAGDELSVSTPSGNGFTLKENSKVALVAGGVGLAPIHCLAQALSEQACDVTIYYGARTEALLYPEAKSAPLPFKWVLSTDDGSFGKHGFATTFLEEDLHREGYDFCYATGPGPMMKAVWKVCQAANLQLEVSLEETMACGVGVCSGCMVPVKGEMKRCCTEGPVFNAEDIYE
jgi:dihydroorotate dehydrogenase electron transfer subunit